MSAPETARLAVYTGGFLFNARLRRILAVHGWDVTPGFAPARADAVGVWGRRPVSRRGLWVARRWNKPVLNIEDAFLRSVRPGQAGEPPMGLLVDAKGLHYDSAQPSALEEMLLAADYDDGALARAARGIGFLRDAGLSKYSDWDPAAAAPEPGYVLVIDQTAGDAAIAHAGAGPRAFDAALAAARAEHPEARIVLRTHPVTASGHRKGHFGAEDLDSRTSIYAGAVNPWALLAGAVAVYVVSSQMGFEAILAGHRPVVFGQPFYAGWGLSDDRAPVPRRGRSLSVEALFHAAMIDYPLWYDPYRDQACSFEVAAEALAAQARAFRENRRPVVCAGMSAWKHTPLRAFLGGAVKPEFESEPMRALNRGKALGRDVLIWAGKETEAVRTRARDIGVPLWRVEDGFLRSVGLGAQLLPAASLVLDNLGIYFDPRHESRLERIINESADLAPHARLRADALARAIVAARLTKYNVGQSAQIPRPEGAEVVLVPGQVEDDASIRTGTQDVSTNLELLRRARAHFPRAYIVFKPHPDVEVGLRKGAVPEAEAAALADHIAREMSAAEALEQVDVVWTMTSLMGFEALLRGKQVHCLGMPFYAGWGLTEDHGQIAPRRIARPDLSALIHASLIAYPRYFDVQTGLAAPAEVILDRLAQGGAGVSRQATWRHRVVSHLQDRFSRFAPLWRK